MVYKNFCQKVFLELNTLRFKIKNATEKNRVICNLSACVVLFPVLYPLFDKDEVKVSFSKQYILSLNEYLVN